MILLHSRGHELQIVRVQKEVARQDVPREQIYHLGLPVRRRRSGRRHRLQVEHGDPGGPEIELGRRVQSRKAPDQIVDVALEDLRRLFGSLGDLEAVEHVAHLVGAHRPDQVFEDRHGMALRRLGQKVIADIA